MILTRIKEHKPKIFFIGIGGISMSALAKYLIINGFEVSGSDRTLSETTEYLKSLGCKIFTSHNENNILGQDIIIYNSAIDSENPELKKAIHDKMCIVSRVELLQMVASSFLRSIGIAGSHGKTTTTSILSHILLCAGKGFTAHIGGFDRSLGNLYQNGKEIFLTEVCEFNKNINLITCSIAVVLNIDNDHMNCYKDIDELKSCFFKYLDRAEIAVINADDEKSREYGRCAVTFAIDNNAEFTAKVLDEKRDRQLVRFFHIGKKLFDIRLKLSGKHNIYNVLSAVAVAKTLHIDNKAIIDGINSFTGVERRNEIIGEKNNCKIVADYAHHPSEIKCSIEAFKKQYKRFLVVFQPHTYSRTKLLFDDFVKVFKNVDNLCIFKTYPAREKISDGLDALVLSKALGVNYFDDFSILCDYIEKRYDEFDAIIILGAGDLYDKTKLKFCKQKSNR